MASACGHLELRSPGWGSMHAMEIAHLNGIDIAIEREGLAPGKGPRLLLLNGSGMTMASAAILRQPLAGSFDIVTFDYRGIGESTIPDGPFTMADYAADALAVMDHVGWKTCRVVGISFGGMVAQELAVTAPERVERLALLCTSAGGAGGSSFPLHAAGTDPGGARHPLHPRLAGRAPRRCGARGRACKAGPRGEGRRDDPRRAVPARRPEPPRRLGPASAITAPTFVGGGRFDGLAPFVNSEAIASRIGGAELHGYDGGHAFFVQDASAFPEVVAFLAA